MHVGVSGRRTPLAAPGRRTPDNLLGCIRDIGGRIDEGWILSAKFEEYRSQILCGRLHDDLANLDAPGEEDEVEWQLEQLCHLVLATCDGSYGSRGQKFLWIRSSKTLLVAGKPSESLRMHGLPAARTCTAGSKRSVNGPLNGPITKVTP